MSKARDDILRICYVLVASWLRDASLYMNTGLGSNAIEQQIRAGIEGASETLQSMSVGVGEPPGSGGWGALIIDLARALPLLPRYRSFCRDIIEFLILRV